MSKGVYVRTKEHLKKMKNYGFQKGNIPWSKGKVGVFSKAVVKRISESMKGKRSHAFKGGKIIDKQGYILVYKPKHPFTNGKGYVREHRLIMEQYLSRYLSPIETVHHINRNLSDNRIKNLMLFKNQSEHIKHHCSNFS